MFCIKFQELLKVFFFFFSLLKYSFLVVKTDMHLLGDVFSTASYMAAIMSGFKDGGQVILPVGCQ
jgi:hypothetical protein